MAAFLVPADAAAYQTWQLFLLARCLHCACIANRCHPLPLLLSVLPQEDVLVSLDLSRTIFSRIRLNYVWVSVEGQARAVCTYCGASSIGWRQGSGGRECWAHGPHQASNERRLPRITTAHPIL